MKVNTYTYRNKGVINNSQLLNLPQQGMHLQ